MERVEIPMPAEMVDALDDVAAEEYTNNRSAAVRDAVSDLLEKHGRKQE
jgi:metal-responsive CopG/Arc/MetJ family transcriptional regulator